MSSLGARDRQPDGRSLDLDPEGAGRMRRALALPHGPGAADGRGGRGEGGDDRPSADPAGARRICHDGRRHGAPVHLPGQGAVRDVRHLRSGLRHQMGQAAPLNRYSGSMPAIFIMSR